jgi:two-component system, sensor histidine kinase PdtaS
MSNSDAQAGVRGREGFDARRRRAEEENRRLRVIGARADARHALLLREADHRIKNSLQIVASLIDRQAQSAAGAAARDELRDASARVRSIACIHNAVQDCAGEDLVDLGGLVASIGNSLQAMTGHAGAITIVVSTEPIQASVSLARPILLVVNELVVNALRHAFPGNRAGTVHVSVARVGELVRIVVADDGKGIRADQVSGQGYGMTLVRLLTDQIGGNLVMDCASGTRFTLAAPAPDAKLRG